MWLSCATQEQIAEAVGVAQQTVKDWTDGFTESPEDGLSVFPPGFEPPIYNVWKKQTKQKKAREMWLACATQEEIAEAVGVHVDTASDWSKGFSELFQANKSEFPLGFEPPIYNVWKQQTKSNAVTLLEHTLKLTA
jgi:DNA-binding XRE family transcriptional regulator